MAKTYHHFHHNPQEMIPPPTTYTEVPSNPIAVSVTQAESPLSLWTAIAAVLIALLALAWNIIREFLIDRPRLNVGVDVGITRPVTGAPDRPIFISLAALTKKSSNPIVFLFTMTNIGRQPIIASQICAKFNIQYKKSHPESKPYWVQVTKDLPVALKPYEVHREMGDPKQLINDLLNDYYDYFFVTDTKGKNWKVSGRAMKKIKKTLNDKKDLIY